MATSREGKGMTPPQNLAVLVSGSGTNLKSFIDHGVPIALVLADKPCKALDIAAEAGIPTVLIDRRDFGYQKGAGEGWDRKGFTVAVAETLNSHGIELVAMAGFFTILHAIIFELLHAHIINIHPSLLPLFKGETAVADALESGATQTGSTVHIATERLDDERYILGQVVVAIVEGDDVDTLWTRIKQHEHKLYPSVLHGILRGDINLAEVVASAA